MAIKVGLSLWINSFLKEKPDKLLDKLLNNNIDFIELSIDYPWPYNRRDLLFKALDFIRDRKLYLGLHAPWRDLAIASPYEDISEASVRVVIDSLKNILDKYDIVKYVVIHASTHQKIEVLDSLEDLNEKLVKRIEKIYSGISKYNNVYLLIENLSYSIAGNMDFLVKALEKTSIERIGFCLDIGHLARYYNRNIAGSGYYRDFYDYLREVLDLINNTLNDRVLTVHLHDVDNENEHLLIGEGFLNFKEIYRLLGLIKPEYVVYEVFRSKKRKINIESILDVIGAQKTWLRIYAY